MSEASKRTIRLREVVSQIEGTTNNNDVPLIDDLLRNEHVLIIGSEAVLKKDAPKTQGTGDSLVRVYNAIAERNGIADEERPNSEQEWQILFSKKGYNRQACVEAWDYIWKNEQDTIIDNVDGDLYDLIETKLFHIVLTTCVDPILEFVMKAVWGKELKVYNFNREDDCTIGEFIKMRNERKKNHLPMEPSLVYLFGKIGDKSGLGRSLPFVFDEFDAIDCIANFIRKTTDNDKSFFDYMFSNRVMSIGCQFDDWRFRFFWYAIRGTKDEIKNGTVAYTCKEQDSLSDYLRRNEVHIEKDSRVFMRRLVNLLQNKDVYRFLMNKRTANAQSVFISYASEDFQEAYKIFKIMLDEGFNVWLDSVDLHQNDVYKDVIEKAIKNCGIFMPILSNQVKSDLEKENVNRYYFTEWNIARLDGKTIVPVVIEGYDYRKEYHLITREKLGYDENDITIKHFFTEREDIIQRLRKNIQLL